MLLLIDQSKTTIKISDHSSGNEDSGKLSMSCSEGLMPSDDIVC